jgi:hypothetical protein
MRQFLTAILPFLLAAACSKAPAAGAPDDVLTTDTLQDALIADVAADVPEPADVTQTLDVADVATETDAAPKLEDAADVADAGSIGPAVGPSVAPPPDATWTVAGDCVQAEPVATPGCMTVKCSAGNVCLGSGICTPAEPFALATGTLSQVAPALASRPDGAWALAWYDGTLDTEMHVFLQVSLAGNAALSPPLQVDLPGAHFAYAPSLVALADGTWLVVWRDEQFFAGTVQYFGRRLATDGSFALAPPFEITSGPQWAGNGSTNVVSPLAVRLRDQSVLVAWPAAGKPGELISVHARRLDTSGAPLGLELETGSNGPGVESYSPAIAPLPQGASLLVWQSASNKGHVQVFGRHFDGDGMPVGDVAPLSAGQMAYEALPAVAAFDDGGVFVTWKESDMTTSTSPVAIAGKAWSALQVQGKAQTVGLDKDGSYPDQAPVATLANERAAIVWHSIAADGGVFLRRYYRAPDKLDCETTDVAGPIALPETGPRHLPAVEALPDGRVLVAWDTLEGGVSKVRIRILGW